MRRKLHTRGLEGLVGFRKDQLSSLTVVFAVQPWLYYVVELEDEGTRCCEEPGVATDIFGIGPENPISSGGFRSRGTPNLNIMRLCSCHRVATNILSVSCNVKVASRSY